MSLDGECLPGMFEHAQIQWWLLPEVTLGGLIGYGWEIADLYIFGVFLVL